MNHDASALTLRRTFRVLVEDDPGPAWQTVFQDGWPGWRAWLRGRRRNPGPSLRACRTALRRHMPEFLAIWERLIEKVGAGHEAAAFLSFWCPPPFLGHCSQVARGGANPMLVRNYDLDPRLSEATLLHTRWRGRAVAGMVDGLCGLADGINESGLAISLAYGGRRAVGRGFGVPIVVRYLLETCDRVSDAVTTLRRLPHHMAYNLTLVDRAGAFATVFLAPDGPIVVRETPFATNHQDVVYDEGHASFCRTRERAAHLAWLCKNPNLTSDELLASFFDAPLYTNNHREGFGTVYTAAYDPIQQTVALHWPGHRPLIHALQHPRPQERAVTLALETDRSVITRGATDWLHYLPSEVQKLIATYCSHGWPPERIAPWTG